MKTYSSEVINLKSYNLSENDKIVLGFSKEKGLLRFVVKGAKKLKGKNSGNSQILVANKLLLNCGKKLDFLNQAEMINAFSKIRFDEDKLFFSMYISELILNFSVEEDPNAHEIYELIYNCLLKISNSKTKLEVALSVIRFQLKFMYILGVFPEFEFCTICNKKIKSERLLFSFETSSVICEKCIEEERLKINFGNCADKKESTNLKMQNRTILNKKLVVFFLAMKSSDFEEITTYDSLVNEKVCRRCFSFLHKCLNFQADKKFKTLEFLEEITQCSLTNI